MTNVGTPTSYQSGLLVQGDGTLIDSALLFSQMAAAGGNGTVSVGAGTVSLAGTPTMSLAGTPTMSIGAGTVSIGAGTVSVAGTPTVSVGAGTVSIAGTPTMSVGAGTVSLAGTPTVLANQGAAAATTAPWPIYRVPRTVGTVDTVAGAAGGTPTLTYAAAGAGTAHILAGLYWSYSAAPTGGSITLQDGSGTTIFQVDVTAAGPGFLPFDPPIQGRTNTSLIVTGYPGGTAAVVKLNAEHWTG